jgi:hypothetical protein
MITKNIPILRAAISRIFPANRKRTGGQFTVFSFPCFRVPLFSLFLACATLPVCAGDCDRISYLRPLTINPYSVSAPKIYAADGTYLGRLSSNPYLTDSISNPYGRYGSPYSSTSINNPYSRYGSPYSSISPNNPFATRPPVLCFD